MLPRLWLRFPGPKTAHRASSRPRRFSGGRLAQKGESDALDGLFGVGDSNVGNFVGSLVQTGPICCPIRGAWMRKAISQTDAGLILRIL
jgi:hypothetical protein